MTSDQARLSQYIDAWKASVDDSVALLRSLDEDDWSRTTDLPGWDVRAVASHLAHLESELAGFEQAPVDVPELAHIRSPMGTYTEMGPLARARRSAEEIIDELETAASARSTELRDNPPTDGTGRPPRTPGGLGWDWETLLSNRVLDVWMHEQDIRRAVGRPGGLNRPGAAHAAQVFTRSFPFSVGNRVAPPAGTTAVLDVSGVSPVHLAVEVTAEGRAVPMSIEPDRPTVQLSMDLETFIVLGGGRRSSSEVDVQVTGDHGLGRRILDAMAVTP
jgi:uncharacterized protein (TIGR03083 family)